TAREGTCARYHLTMNVAGALHVTKNEKPVALKLNAAAKHDFTERLLGATAGIPQKAARLYDAAEATIDVDRDHTDRTLPKDRTLLVAQRTRDQIAIYCPKGMLTSDEMELTSGHFDTLSLVGLLPAKAVAVNDTWKIPTSIVQGLCHMEGVTSQDLVGKLEAV